MRIEHHDTLVVGAGQAGLAVGYHLKAQGRDFVILDAAARIGDAWRNRWASLRLFTPARLDALPGLPFPAPPNHCPGKDEMADYLAAYAATFELPVRLGIRVERLTRHGGRYLLEAGPDRLSADRVVVATGPFQRPRVPVFAGALDPAMPQLQASAYRHPDQLPPGLVLVVGAGNSGAEIAVDLASAGRRVLLSGRDPGHLPGGSWGCGNHALGSSRALMARGLWPLMWWLLTRRLTADTRRGRKIMSLRQGRTSSPLIRLTPRDLDAKGIARLPRTEGVKDGRPRLADGRVLDVDAVVWATGYAADYGWIRLPIFDEDGYPRHHRGVAAGQPGLYFLGLPFQHTLVSEMVAGEVFDAAYVAAHIAAQERGGGLQPEEVQAHGVVDQSR